MSGLIGKRGRATTALHPTGTVEINGSSFQARCVRRIVEAGAQVVITGRDADGSLLCAPADVVDHKTLLNVNEPRASPEGNLEREMGKPAVTWNAKVYVVFLVALFAIFPVVGGLAHGVEGIGVGVLGDVLLVWVFVFGGGSPSITPGAEPRSPSPPKR